MDTEPCRNLCEKLFKGVWVISTFPFQALVPPPPGAHRGLSIDAPCPAALCCRAPPCRLRWKYFDRSRGPIPHLIPPTQGSKPTLPGILPSMPPTVPIDMICVKKQGRPGWNVVLEHSLPESLPRWHPPPRPRPTLGGLGHQTGKILVPLVNH